MVCPCTPDQISSAPSPFPTAPPTPQILVRRKARQAIQSARDKLAQTQPAVLVRVEPREHAVRDDAALALLQLGLRDEARRVRVVQSVDGLDLGEGEVAVAVEVVESGRRGSREGTREREPAGVSSVR